MNQRYTLIKGEFHITFPGLAQGDQPQPDGDTIRFIPSDPFRVLSLKRYGNRCADIRRNGINIRVEGIDALETHFGKTHQRLAFARQARDHLLQRLGFQGVVFGPDDPAAPDASNVVQAVANNPRPGYVVANGVDSNGRMLGFVFAGQTAKVDGSSVFLDEALMEDSINIDLIDRGLAYAELYTSLPMTLLDHLAGKVAQARQVGQGFWPAESLNTAKQATPHDLEGLQTLVMWPKLFRRLSTFFQAGNASLSTFGNWLRQDTRDRDDRVILPNRELGNMHDLIVVQGEAIGLKFQPEQVIILPDEAC